MWVQVMYIRQTKNSKGDASSHAQAVLKAIGRWVVQIVHQVECIGGVSRGVQAHAAHVGSKRAAPHIIHHACQPDREPSATQSCGSMLLARAQAVLHGQALSTQLRMCCAPGRLFQDRAEDHCGTGIHSG